jgi:hypothetical protein
MKTAIATLAALVAATGAAAAEPANEVELGSFARGLRSPSANAITDGNLGAAQFAYARRLPLDVMPDLSLWAVGRFAFGGSTGEMFQSMATSIEYLELAAGVRARYELHPHIFVGARADLGLAHTELDISDANRTYYDAKWGGVTDAAVQLELLAAAHAKFSLGMRLEFGYAVTTARALSPRADSGAGEGTIMLPVDRSSIGGLDLGGPYFGLTFFGQF